MTLASSFHPICKIILILLCCFNIYVHVDSNCSAFTEQEKAIIKEMKGTSICAVFNRILTTLVKDLALEDAGANLSKLDEEKESPEWVTNCLYIYFEVKEMTDEEKAKSEPKPKKRLARNTANSYSIISR